jgi:uncharacterized protein
MTDQDRKQLATSFIEALRARDANGFRAIMTDDVVWTLPGTSLVSGIAKGVEGILKRARTIVDYGANVEIQHVVLGYARGWRYSSTIRASGMGEFLMNT